MTVNWWCAPYHVTPGRWGWAFWRQHVTWCHLCCSEGSLCILHWSLCVCKEFRSVWLALEAVIMTPRASRSTIIENRLASLSTPRLVIVLMSFVLRIAIASIMLVAGVNWLGRTTSITATRPNSSQCWPAAMMCDNGSSRLRALHRHLPRNWCWTPLPCRSVAACPTNPQPVSYDKLN